MLGVWRQDYENLDQVSVYLDGESSDFGIINCVSGDMAVHF